MTYVPNPVDGTNPLDSIDASTAAAEFRALKTYIQGGIISQPGDIIWTATATRIGCVLCDGSYYDGTNATYAALYAAIGFTFGGNLATAFKVPDLRGRAMFGMDPSNGTGRLNTSASSGIDASALGNAGGLETITMLATNLVAHGHTVTITDPGHIHAVTDPQHNHTQNAHNHTITEPNSGQGHLHGSVASPSFPAGATLAGGGGYNVPNSNTGYATTGISINNTTPTNNPASTGLTVNSGVTGITAVANNSTGGGTPMNNVPPGLVLNAFIKL